ncbi:MAG: hypothetical protein JSS08_03315 [Proteobacteria bacterium]|nr:hypothetical protein [Pseudomonadota bacterium]
MRGICLRGYIVVTCDRLPGRKVLAAALLSLALVPAAALAGPASPRAGAVVRLPGGVVFNWLAPKKVRSGQIQNPELTSAQDAAPAVQSRYFGHGSYICSPAGFGMKSRCFAR